MVDAIKRRLSKINPGNAVTPTFSLRLSGLFAETVNIAAGYGSFAAYASGP